MKSVAIALALGLVGAATVAACRVPNEEHCANQDVPGNQFCRERNPGAPYCSPCERRLRGCVQFEPFACPGYDPDPGDVDEDPATTTGASTGDVASSTTTEPTTTTGATSAESG